jgi:hypothetical protein
MSQQSEQFGLALGLYRVGALDFGFQFREGVLNHTVCVIRLLALSLKT